MEKTKCLCGKPAGHNRFMIKCDGCMFWLHGSCLGITIKTWLPDKWFCPRCSNSSGLSSSVVEHHEYDQSIGKQVELCERKILALEQEVGKIHEAITTLNGGLEDIRHSLTTSKHPDPAQGHEAVMSEITGTLDVNANKNSGIVSSLTEELGKIWSTLESLNGGVADIKSFITATKHPDPALGNEAVTMSEITGALDQNANKTSGIVSSLKEELEKICHTVTDLNVGMADLKRLLASSKLQAQGHEGEATKQSQSIIHQSEGAEMTVGTDKAERERLPVSENGPKRKSLSLKKK